MLDTFDDGSRLVEFTIAVGGEWPDDFRVLLKSVKAGVIFDDGTLERWVTADDLDELGRYTYRMVIPGDVPGSACHYYQYFDGDEPINKQI